MKQLYAGEFGWSVGWRVGLFALLSLGFPFIIYALMAASKCSGQGGACGAVALVGSFYLRPIIAGGFLLLMIGPPAARCRALGLPGLAGLVVPLLLFTDRQFLLLLGSHWSFGFVTGVLWIRLPVFLILAVVTLVAMALVREPVNADDGLWERHGWFGKATLAAIFLTAALCLMVDVIGLASPTAYLMGGHPVGGRSIVGLWIAMRHIATVMSWAAVLAIVGFVVLDVTARPTGGPSAGDDAGGADRTGPGDRDAPSSSPSPRPTEFGRRHGLP